MKYLVALMGLTLKNAYFCSYNYVESWDFSNHCFLHPNP